jgi:hypothetical protein
MDGASEARVRDRYRSLVVHVRCWPKAEIIGTEFTPVLYLLSNSGDYYMATLGGKGGSKV